MTERSRPGGAAASTDTPARSTTSDRQDERLRNDEGWVAMARASLGRIRSGDIGVLPVIAGLVVIWVVLQALNPIFLSPANLSNLLLESAPAGVIALGVVCVLLVGQIDLSIGSVSGLSSAIVAVLFVTQGLPLVVAILGAVLAGGLIGLLYALVFTRFGVPTFVITLAGLLGFLGVQLYVLGANGSINLPFDSALVTFAQLSFVPPVVSYVLVVLAVAAFFGSRLALARRRTAAGLSATPVSLLVVQGVVLLVGLLAAVAFLNQGRGIGWMFVLFVVLVLALHYALTRTRWGRSVFAVGGNVEAARRAGINVNGVFISVMVLCSSLAAVGGVLAAARLAAANQASGTGDVNLNAIAAAVIGGTSLFGGRGSAASALLGIVVIQSISSGLTLLNLSSSFRFMITGLVLLLAVALDSISRRSRTSHGRA